ncbi:MAG TPA: hypothetical protein VHT91_21780 [Kofleriaceae bacterium]|nr:hypothetical protein [Kofleriaceae bacterium]
MLLSGSALLPGACNTYSETTRAASCLAPRAPIVVAGSPLAGMRVDLVTGAARALIGEACGELGAGAVAAAVVIGVTKRGGNPGAAAR